MFILDKTRKEVYIKLFSSTIKVKQYWVYVFKIKEAFKSISV